MRTDIKLAFQLSCLIFGIVRGQAQQVACNVQRCVYPVWGSGDDVQLAAGLQVGIYPEGTTMTKVKAELAGVSADARLAIPEALILREFELTRTGDKDAILANYWGEEGRKYAETGFSDMDAARDYNINKIKDLQFLTKTIFGPLVRIRYRRLAKAPDGFSPPWSSTLRMYNGRFYFVNELPQNHIFPAIAEGFPYWKTEQERQCTHLDDFLKAAFSYGQDKTSLDYQDSQLVVYYKIKQFAEKGGVSQKEIMSPSLREELTAFIKRVVQVSREGTVEDLLKLWIPHRQESIMRQMELNSKDTERSRLYFKKADRVQMEFYIGDSQEFYLYLRPLYKGEFGQLKLLRIKREEGNYISMTKWNLLLRI